MTTSNYNTFRIVNIRLNEDPDRSPIWVDLGRPDEGLVVSSIWITKNADPYTQKVAGGFPFAGCFIHDIIIDEDVADHTSEELLEYLLSRMRYYD